MQFSEKESLPSELGIFRMEEQPDFRDARCQQQGCVYRVNAGGYLRGQRRSYCAPWGAAARSSLGVTFFCQGSLRRL